MRSSRRMSFLEAAGKRFCKSSLKVMMPSRFCGSRGQQPRAGDCGDDLNGPQFM